MPTPTEKTVMVFVTNGDKVLLHKRLNTWFGNNQFAAPGGLVDEGETVEEAAVRELLEETNIKVSTESLNLISKDTSKGKGREFFNYYFHTTVWSGELKLNEPERHSDLGWYSIHDLPPDVMPIVKKLISKLELYF